MNESNKYICILSIVLINSIIIINCSFEYSISTTYIKALKKSLQQCYSNNYIYDWNTNTDIGFTQKIFLLQQFKFFCCLKMDFCPTLNNCFHSTFEHVYFRKQTCTDYLRKNIHILDIHWWGYKLLCIPLTRTLS